MNDHQLHHELFRQRYYQLVVLYLMGRIIPIKHGVIKLPRGYGIRNTVSFLNMRQKLDNLLAISIAGVKIPVLTFIIIALPVPDHRLVQQNQARARTCAQSVRI